MASAERGRDEVVGLLVERKASLDTQDPGGSFLGGGLWVADSVRWQKENPERMKVINTY